MSERARTISIWDPGIVRQADGRLLPEARSPDPVQEPGDVHRRGRQPPHDDHLHPGTGRRRRASRCSPARSPSGSGSPCSSPTSPRRWPKAAARRRPTRCARRGPRRVANRLDAGRPHRDGAGREPPQGRRGDGARRRVHSGRRRDHRRRRVGRRIGDHRRVGAGHPRIGRRSLGGHRRHARHLGLDQGARHLRPRPHLPRSHDRARRGRRAAEDAERDRAEHPAGGADAGVPAGRRDAAAVRATTPARRSRFRC